MKRGKLRKKSKNGTRKLIEKADKALQDHYRREFPNDRCESCGARAELRHHFIEKSQSARLRYDPINLIAICKSCHFRHHQTGDQTIMSRVILKRGTAWHKKVLKLKQESIQLDRKLAIKIINQYEQTKTDIPKLALEGTQREVARNAT